MLGVLARYTLTPAPSAAGYFTSRNCLREVRATEARELPVLLVHEKDVHKGGLPIEASVDECPDELRGFVFGKVNARRQVLVWHRVTAFQLCTLKEIARTVLNLTPLYLNEPLDVYLRVDCDVEDLHFPVPVVAYAPVNNIGCWRVATEIARSFSRELFVRDEPPSAWAHTAGERVEEGGGGGATTSSPAVTSRLSLAEISRQASAWATSLEGMSGFAVAAGPPDLDRCRQIFLLYFNRNTWHGAAGRELAAEVRIALEVGAEIVMLHESDPERDGCEFNHFFGTTPVDLINLGLYEPIAVLMANGPHRRVSLSLAAQAMGARRRAARRVSLHRGRSFVGGAAELSLDTVGGEESVGTDQDPRTITLASESSRNADKAPAAAASSRSEGKAPVVAEPQLDTRLEPDDLCPLCLEPLELENTDRTSIMRMPVCGHRLHTHCALDMAGRHGYECPVCRTAHPALQKPRPADGGGSSSCTSPKQPSQHHTPRTRARVVSTARHRCLGGIYEHVHTPGCS